MAKKNLSQKRALRQQQEREALNNILNIFLLGLLAECYLLVVYRFYAGGTVNSLLLWDNILKVLSWVGLGMTVLGGAAAVWKRKEPKIVKVASYAALAGLFLAVTGWVMITFFDIGVIAMCIAVPVLTVLGLIYFLYQHECFLCTALLAGSFFTVWICGKGLDSNWGVVVTVCSALVVIALLLIAIAAGRVKKADGKFRGIRLFTQDCDYRVIYGVCAVCAALILVALFVPTVAYYVIWALGVLLFVELAYFTAKMM